MSILIRRQLSQWHTHAAISNNLKVKLSFGKIIYRLVFEPDMKQPAPVACLTIGYADYVNG